MKWMAAIALLTLVSAATGGLLGLHLLSAGERVSEAQRVAPGSKPVATYYTGSARLRRLAPIVTNLVSPSGTMARLEASLVLDNVDDDDASLLAARISEDIVTYLRTLAVPQLEGVRGLQYLREDLNERATVRSGGKVRELIIETLVVQ